MEKNLQEPSRCDRCTRIVGSGYFVDLIDARTGVQERYRTLCDCCFEHIDCIVQWQPQRAGYPCESCNDNQVQVFSRPVDLCSPCATDIAEYIDIGRHQEKAKDNDASTSSSEYDDDLPF